MRRSEQRRAAVVALYQYELTGRSLTDVLGRNTPLFTRALAHAAADHAEELDAVIERHSEGWALSRIAPLELSIMRVALVEMLHPDLAPSDTPIPAEGAIDEAVETAKVFCGVDAPGFVNGILAAALRAQQARQRRVAGAASSGAPPGAPDEAEPDRPRRHAGSEEVVRP